MTAPKVYRIGLLEYQTARSCPSEKNLEFARFRWSPSVLSGTKGQSSRLSKSVLSDRLSMLRGVMMDPAVSIDGRS